MVAVDEADNVPDSHFIPATTLLGLLPYPHVCAIEVDCRI